MNYTVTKYPAGTFSWVDVASTDMAKTKKFMTKLLGWTSTDMPTGEGMPDYTMFYLDGKDVAGGSPMPPEMMKSGMSSMWNSYVTVENVDEAAKKAEELGGKIVMPAIDVFDSGRMAGVMDPTGATLFLWQPKKHIGSKIVNTVGSFCWNELYTKDLDAAKKFYSALFGWTYDVDAKSGYVTIKNKGRMNGGMMEITDDMKGAVPMWVVYFTVEDVEKSVAMVKEMGGTVHMGPKEMSVGKITMIADPTDASCMLMEMSVAPEEWVE
ncbi:VOC family protein [Candidatus Woesebacteria bacterium]|nr:VOC family protein [Candidatus Woesebacteria bacterium]